MAISTNQHARYRIAQLSSSNCPQTYYTQVDTWWNRAMDILWEYKIGGCIYPPILCDDNGVYRLYLDNGDTLRFTYHKMPNGNYKITSRFV